VARFWKRSDGGLFVGTIPTFMAEKDRGSPRTECPDSVIRKL